MHTDIGEFTPLNYLHSHNTHTCTDFELLHVDEFIDELLREDRVCDIILPRIQKRAILEQNELLEPRVSALDEDLSEVESEEEEEPESDHERDRHNRRSSSPSHGHHDRDRNRRRSRSRSPGHRRFIIGHPIVCIMTLCSCTCTYYYSKTTNTFSKRS